MENWKIFWKIFLGETYYIFTIWKVLKIKVEQVICNAIPPLSLFPFLFSSLFFPLHFIDYGIIEKTRVKCGKYWSTEGNTEHRTSFKKGILNPPFLRYNFCPLFRLILQVSSHAPSLNYLPWLKTSVSCQPSLHPSSLEEKPDIML